MVYLPEVKGEKRCTHAAENACLKFKTRIKVIEYCTIIW